jgi:hypothetical protein
MEKNKMHMRKYIWIQGLRLTGLASFIFKSTFCDISIRYDENGASRFSKLLIKLLKGIGLCKAFDSFVLHGDRKDNDGSTLFYKIYQYMESCISQFNKAYISDEPEWFKKMTASYLLNWTSNPFYFIVMVKEEFPRFSGAKHEIYISGYPVNAIIKKFYRPDGFTIKTIFSISEFIKPVILPFYILFNVFFRQIFSYTHKSNIEHVKPSVWVEYEGIRTMLSFWHEYVNKKEFDLVYYIDRPDTGISAETLNKCAADGFKWVDGRNMGLARVDASCLKEAILALFTCSRGMPIWLRFFRVSFIIYNQLYLSIFKRFKVKIFIQHQNTSWRQQAQAMAVESAGGIMIGFHWSFTHVLLPFFLTPEHVYFVWGKYMYDYLQKKGHTCRYILPCGLWMIKDETVNIENDFSDKINFVMAIVDSSVAHNIYHTSDTLSKFYLMALRLIEQHPTWGGIVKSKNWDLEDFIFLPRGNEIISRMIALIDNKKLVLMNHNVSPVTASANADLTVAYALQTAGIVAGANGHPVVIWDVAGWLDCQFYTDEGQKFLYPAMDRLEDAIIAFSKGDRSIGDFSRWREQFNYFSDDRTSQKVGGFIQDFMNDVTVTGDMEESLHNVVQKYCKVSEIEIDSFRVDDKRKK